MERLELWKDMLSWVFFYVSLGLFLWGTFSIWHGERTARFFIRKYGRWKAMMKYERMHRFCPYSPFHLWYERYCPENQFEYRLFKRAIYKSRILNILAIQFLANVLATWIKWYVIAECCYVEYKESIVELFREDAPHTQRKKGTIYCVIRDESSAAVSGILASVAAIGFIVVMKYFGHSLSIKVYFFIILAEILFFLLGLTPYLYEITLEGSVICRQILNRRKYWNISDIDYCRVSMWNRYPVIYVYMKGHMLPVFYVSRRHYGFMRFLRCMKFARPRNSKKPVRPIVPLIGKEKLDDYFLRQDI